MSQLIILQPYLEYQYQYQQYHKQNTNAILLI